MVRKKVKKLNLSSLSPVTPRGIGVKMGCGWSLPAPSGCSSLLPNLPIPAQALPWAAGVSLLQQGLSSAAWGGSLLWACSPSCPPPPPAPLEGPSSAAPSLDASGTSAPLLSISVALSGVSGPFWASDCPCQRQHTAGCVPGPATTWVSPKHWIQSPVEIKNSKHPLVRKIRQSLWEGFGAC